MYEYTYIFIKTIKRHYTATSILLLSGSPRKMLTSDRGQQYRRSTTLLLKPQIKQTIKLTLTTWAMSYNDNSINSNNINDHSGHPATIYIYIYLVI